MHAMRQHWPEYLIEAGALGCFMISAGVMTTLIEYPDSPLHALLPDPTSRRVLIGIGMGLTAILLIQSPWGQRSGAHMNPAVTLAFLRLGRTARSDAICYVTAQFIGAMLGTLLVRSLLGFPFTTAPVYHITTLPGPNGVLAAIFGEFAISFIMMTMVLQVSASPRYARLTGYMAGLLVAIYISFEAPLSGMSMNPARSFGSALSAWDFRHFWIYLLTPLAGMLTAAELHLHLGRRVACAKLLHPSTQPCIHCGYQPEVHGHA
jgi:aquaporin Z